MHELSIAISLLDLAEEEARRRNVRVLALHLRLGPLSGVIKEALLSAYDMAREGTPMADAELKIEDVPLAAYCPACCKETAPASIGELVCPDCGAPTPQIIRGREMELTALEVEDDETANSPG